MELVYKKYQPEESIPIYEHVSNRKVVKYYNRDVMAAMVAMGELFKGSKPHPETPFFFATSEMEFIETLHDKGSSFELLNSEIDSTAYVTHVLPLISPTNYFKMMRNIAHCYISFEYGLRGDNAALLGSLSGLLTSALFSKTPKEDNRILIGASKLSYDNSAEAGVALLTAEELALEPLLNSDKEAICFFREKANK